MGQGFLSRWRRLALPLGVVAALVAAWGSQALAGSGTDLRIVKSDSPDPVQVGHQLTYTLEVTNNGPGFAPSVFTHDTLPASVNFLSASAGCTESAGTVSCDVGSLDDGDKAAAEIVVRPTVTGTIQNTATVTADVPDTNGRNNVSVEDTTVQAICMGQVANVVGTLGDDKGDQAIKGTPEADVIDALGGSDQVSGLRGDDRICGDAGADTISGDAGSDHIQGNKGSDSASGGRGDDFVHGGVGSDSLFGGPGTDFCNGGPDTDAADPSCEAVHRVP